MKWKAFITVPASVLGVLLIVAAVLVGCGKDSPSGQPATQRADGKTSGEAPGVSIPLPPITSTAPALTLRADGKDREPAVQGLWYPAQPQDLARTVDMMLATTVAKNFGKVRGIIVPHAGYEFSGLTAAVAYKQLMGQDVDTAIVMASAHTATFEGACIPSYEAFRTPLGRVPVSPKAAVLAKVAPLRPAPNMPVKRITDEQLKSKLPPPPGQENPHTWDHTIEAQLPFLQWTLRNFQIVPILFGQVDPGQVAAALASQIDDKTVLIASSDLSHYHPYDEATGRDAWCLQAVRDMDLKLMAAQEACGKDPILTLMQIAKERSWKPHVLDYRNSGDVPKVDRNRVVGYMAVIFTEGGETPSEPLTEQEGAFLVKVARQYVAAAVRKEPWPQLEPGALPSKLLQPRAAFVTLNRGGKLRGCIGYTLAVRPLIQTVMESAVNAALHDERFKPVTPEELKDIVVDVSVLTQPTPIYYNTPSELLKKLRPKIDGVVLEVPVTVQGRSRLAQAVYLPAVWEEIPDPGKFLDQLSIKAGLPAGTWRQPAASILIFQAEDFKEAGPAPATVPAPAPAPAATTQPAKG